MRTSGTDIAPAVFRAGDIGVASEWRDLSYDWTPILTPMGVSMYEHCRDTYDQQRALYPFLLSPQGPTKQAMQRKLGLRTGFALQGPEYLLATVGLLHVEVGAYGPSYNPERPNHTRIAYYVVGRLDHPTLDWPMLDRLLQALYLAAEPRNGNEELATQQKKAEAALRSLGQAGFLQMCDPDDLFYPLGAWPHLLPTLLADERWEALFSLLHGTTAVQQYRQHGRAWVEYAQRLARRLRQENDAIRDQVIAAQRNGSRGGASFPPSTPGHSVAADDERGSSPATAAPGQAKPASQPTRPGTSAATSSQKPATQTRPSERKPVSLTPTGSVAALSLPCRYPVSMAAAGSATSRNLAQQAAVQQAQMDVAEESLRADQLTSRCCSEKNETTSTPAPVQLASGSSDIVSVTLPDTLSPVAPHLQDAELATTRYDATFWCAVNRILYGVADRYPHTPGEKKAVERRFKHQDMPVGVVLAALRAVMTLPEAERPRRFGDALTLQEFQACVQQALALLPARALAAQEHGSWPAFLQAYREIGMAAGLRNVSVTDYQVLWGLFQAQPAECWDVLNRVEHAASKPNLSPAYLRQAMINNQQAAARQTLSGRSPARACRTATSANKGAANDSVAVRVAADDPRAVMLEQVGLSRKLLRPWTTVEYIQAWLDEATARPGIENVQGWLIWALGEQCLPHEHPTLPPRPALKVRSHAAHGRSEQPAPPVPSVVHSDRAQTWQAVLKELAAQVPQSELDTWLSESVLLDLAADQAVVGVPNIFVREQVEGQYMPLIRDALEALIGWPVALRIVIGMR